MWRQPVLVIWSTQQGVRVREYAETEVVNAHGALLRLDSQLPPGKQIDLLDPHTNESRAARVVWSQKFGESAARAGVELATPGEGFWGIYVPMQRALSTVA